MRREFLHYFMLLLIIFYFTGTLITLKKYCPKKLKTYVLISAVLGIVSFSTQFYISLAPQQTYINSLKPLIFMNNLVDVFLILISFYIFLRKEKLAFKWMYLFMGIISIIFIIGMFLVQSIVKVDKIYGYKLILLNDFEYRITFIAVLVILTAIMIIFIDYKYSLKISFILLLVVTIAMIGENLLYMANISLFPYPIISELLLVNLFSYAMYRTRKTN